jgi:hypothetical protein
MKNVVYKGRVLQNVGLSWYVAEAHVGPSAWRWIANSFAAAKRWVSEQ